MRTWWISLSWTHEWSDDEVSARTRIWGLAGIFFLGLFFPGIAVFHALGVERHAGAIGAFAVAIPPALRAARRSAEYLWPDLIKRAEANAARRLGA